MSELLGLAAVALGYPAHLVASDSLRKGGATAMLSVTDDIEVAKRFGGWKSDAVHADLCTDMSAAPERARRMLQSRPVLQPQHSASASRDLRVGCDATSSFVRPPAPRAHRSRDAPLAGFPVACSPAAMDAAAARGMGRQQLQAWMQQWGSAWKFMGLEQGATAGEVMKAYKKMILGMHPDT